MTSSPLSQFMAVIALLFFTTTASIQTTSAFLVSSPQIPAPSSALFAKANKNNKKKKKAGGSAAGIKGFGSVSVAPDVETDRSKEARTFYDFLEKEQAGDNLKRCALGYFPLPNGASLRGVVAMRDLQKGDVIIRIPYQVAINLGQEGGDPTLPALELLRDYCDVLGENGAHAVNAKRRAYYEMLPPFRGEDCLGSTDFFSEEALQALQSPTVVAETLNRRERTKRRFEQDVGDNFPSWIDGSPVMVEHLQWAVWLITSRVLTVQGDAEEGKSYRLLIPFLDMCNHDRKSPHVLSGRAVPGGELKVVAGAAVKAGEQINICYGGGVAGNDRFLQDYGFLDYDKDAYEMVAQQLLGKRRVLEGASAGKTMPAADREEALAKLRSTKMEEDRSLLESLTDNALKAAIEFRLGVKKALSKQIVMQ
jgi:SET domain